MNDRCSTSAIVVKGLLDDINSKLKEYKTMKEKDDSDGIDKLLTKIYNGYRIQMASSPPVLPAPCGKNILDFIQKLIDANPNWSNVRGWTGTKIYTESLNNADVVGIIEKVQEKIDSTVRTGGRRSFKKRTTSAKRKSIKRSRSNRRRYRRTARK